MLVVETMRDLAPSDEVTVRRILDDAFDGAFDEEDWRHSLGGVHVMVRDGDAVGAHAALVERRLWIGDATIDVGYVEAVATRTDRQGSGLGTMAMRAVADLVEQSHTMGALSTGEWHFYERLGWERWRGPTFVRHPDGRTERTPGDDDGIMILRTRRTPTIDLSEPILCESRRGDDW